MIRAFALSIALLAACAPAPLTYRDLDRLGAEYARDASRPPQTDVREGQDTCGMWNVTHLLGVHENDIDRASLPPGARVICHACMVTQDYAPSRLNLHLSAEGRVASMRCG